MHLGTSVQFAMNRVHGRGNLCDFVTKSFHILACTHYLYYAYYINALALNPKGNFQELLVLVCLCGPINPLH